MAASTTTFTNRSFTELSFFKKHLNDRQTVQNITFNDIIDLLNKPWAETHGESKEPVIELIDVARKEQLKAFVKIIDQLSAPPDADISPRTRAYKIARLKLTNYTFELIKTLMDLDLQARDKSKKTEHDYSKDLIVAMNKFETTSTRALRHASHDIKERWQLALACGWAIIKGLIVCAFAAAIGGVSGSWTQNYLYQETIGKTVEVIMDTTGAYTGAITAGVIGLLYTLNSFWEAYEKYKYNYKIHEDQKVHVELLIQELKGHISKLPETLNLSKARP